MFARHPWLLLMWLVILPVLAGCSGTNPVGPPPAPGLEFIFDQILGATGSGDGQFLAPTDVAADAAGALYVVDSGNNRVQKLGSDGAFVLAFGSLGSDPGEFRNPAGIAISGSSVHVSDVGNARVQVFTTDGGFLREFGSQWPEGGSLREPRGIAVSASAVAVADRQQHHVVVYGADGSLVRTIGQLGIGSGEFSQVTGLAVSGSTLYAADRELNNIQAFNLATGAFVETLGRIGSDLGELRGPTALAANGLGLWVLDAGNHRVQLLALTGTPQAVVEPETTPAGSLVNPRGIGAWRGGFVVADTGHDRLVSFVPKPTS